MNFDDQHINSMDELSLQKYIYKRLNTGIKISSISGDEFTIISRGSINRHAGPDIKNMLVINKDSLIICDAEVHKDTNDWYNHKHQLDPAYSKVLLHFCIYHLEKEIPTIHNIDISQLINNKPIILPKKINLLLDPQLQEYSLSRLNSRVNMHKNYISILGVRDSVKHSLTNYLEKYYKKLRKFPVNDIFKINLSIINNFHYQDFVIACSNEYISLSSVEDFFNSRYSDLGENLSKEIFINSILPLSLAYSHSKNYITLMNWYWTAITFQQYGKIKTKFDIQKVDYIWQQQGLLELLKLYDSDEFSIPFNNKAA